MPFNRTGTFCVTSNKDIKYYRFRLVKSPVHWPFASHSSNCNSWFRKSISAQWCRANNNPSTFAGVYFSIDYYNFITRMWINDVMLVSLFGWHKFSWILQLRAKEMVGGVGVAVASEIQWVSIWRWAFNWKMCIDRQLGRGDLELWQLGPDDLGHWQLGPGDLGHWQLGSGDLGHWQLGPGDLGFWIKEFHRSWRRASICVNISTSGSRRCHTILSETLNVLQTPFYLSIL